jgi:hypothetical protein
VEGLASLDFTNLAGATRLEKVSPGIEGPGTLKEVKKVAIPVALILALAGRYSTKGKLRLHDCVVFLYSVPNITQVHLDLDEHKH